MHHQKRLIQLCSITAPICFALRVAYAAPTPTPAKPLPRLEVPVVQPAKVAPITDGPLAEPSTPSMSAEEAPKATPAETVETDPVGAAGTLIGAVKSGQWRLVASLLLAFAMLALSRLRTKIKLFDGDRGGAILVGILALAGALSTALAADAKLDWRLLLGALGVMWTAVGGYTWFKRIIWPEKTEIGKPAESAAVES